MIPAKYFISGRILTLWLLACFFFILSAANASAASVSLAWDAVSATNLSGYKVHYGTQSRSYSNALDAGKNVSYTVPNLAEGKTYYFAVTAQNTAGQSSGYSNEVSYSVPTAAGGTTPPPLASGGLTMDNGTAGTSATGSWLVSTASGAYGAQSLYSKSTSALYTYRASASNAQQVYLWWTAMSSRSTKVPVRIYNGNTLIATVYVDQTKNGGKWNLLGSYNFTGTARVVVVSTSTTLTTCADAVRFVLNEEPETIIDNADPETAKVGTWLTSSASGGFEGSSLYSKTTSSTFTFNADVSGQQDVYLWWAQYSSRSTNVPVKIYNGSTLLATVYVDQTQNGGRWNLLGKYSFSGSARVVILSTSSTLSTCADAVMFK
jgi:hypothetical protein